jgi:hypothetical protein
MKLNKPALENAACMNMLICLASALSAPTGEMDKLALEEAGFRNMLICVKLMF